MRAPWLAILLMLVLVGCQAVRPILPVGGSDRPVLQARRAVPVTGRVDFGAVRSTQASPGDVLEAATVSFIETGSNRTVATGKTDGTGAFSLDLNDLLVTDGATYLLEAVKGLNGHAPGSSAARFRTVLQWQGTGWLSCTNGTIGGNLVVNALTTALAIASALDPTNVPAARTIGKVDLEATPAELRPTPAYSGHPDTELLQLTSDLVSYLGADVDPVAAVPSLPPNLTSFSPGSGAPYSLVLLKGFGFSPVPAGNTVTFAGTSTPAQVFLATATSLVVEVPGDAATGLVRVATGRGATERGTFSVLSTQPTGITLTGFSPRAARPGASVVLSGYFPGNPATDATPSVLFAGDVLASVTGWNPLGRTLTATVPLGAASGKLKVRAGLQTATSLDTFTVQKGDLTPLVSLSSTTAGQEGAVYTLPDALMSHSAATWTNPSSGGTSFCYLSGGLNVANATTSAQAFVRMVALSPDGSIGGFRTAGRLITPRFLHASAVIGNFLYVLGGYDSAGQVLASIERAVINPDDGSLSDFTQIGNLNIDRAEASAVVAGNTIVVLAGVTTPTGTLTKLYDKITVDPVTGNVTAMNSTAVPLTTGGPFNGARGFGLSAAGGYAVMAGGYSSVGTTPSYAYNRVFTWTLDANGNLANGKLQTGVLPVSMANTNVVAATVGGLTKFYVAGGNSTYGYGGTYTKNLYAGSVSGGTLTMASILDASRDAMVYETAHAALIANNNRLYNIGGVNASGLVGSFQSYLITYDNDRWSVIGNSWGSRYSGITLMLGSRLYQWGGANASYAANAAGEYMVIHDDGTLSPAAPARYLLTARTGATAQAVNGWVYVIGGKDLGGLTLNTVERLRYDPQTGATIGDFSTLPSMLNVPRAYMASAVLGDYLYVLGGENGSTKLASLERARLNADGSLGQWELVTGTILPEARSYFSALVVEDYLYLVGGTTSLSAITNDVLIASFDAGGIGSFLRGPSLTTAVHSPAVSRIGGYLYVLGGHTGAAPTTLCQRATINADRTLGAFANHQPGGRDVLPLALSHFASPPAFYRNFCLLVGGQDSAGIASPQVFIGSIQ